MKNLYIYVFALLIFDVGHAQLFQPSGVTNLEGVFYGNVAIGNLTSQTGNDIVLSGSNENYTGFTGLYKKDDTFGMQIHPDFSPILYSSLAITDLDNDGINDFIVTGFDSDVDEQVFEIFYNNGDQTFTKNTSSLIPPVSFGDIEIVDFDNDGLKDIAINGMNDNIGKFITRIYFQTSLGVFTESTDVFLGANFSDIKAFDANNDGFQDLLVTGFSTNYVPETELYINNNGVFTVVASGIDDVYFSSIDVADYDNDGDLDVVVSGFDSSYTPTMKLFSNDGTGLFSLNPTIFVGNYSGGTRFLDYDNDGFIDIFSSGSSGTNGAVNLKSYMYKGDATGNFTDVTSQVANIPGISMGRVALLDFDNDGDTDILTLGLNSNDVAVTSIYENKSTTLSTENFNSSKIQVYPNPVVNNVTINSNEEIVNITVHEPNGKEVYETKTNTQSIDFSEMSKGIYILSISTQNETFQQKIIKQ